MSDALPIKITLGPDGTSGSVIIDGQDMSKYIRGVDVSAGVGDLTQVRLDFVHVEVELDGKVDLAGLGNDWVTFRLGQIMRDELQAAAKKETGDD